jgi:putative alpha-1,2-mannosidase
MAEWAPGTTRQNNGYTYTWDVTHDFNGLITLMGGPQSEANLDQLSRTARTLEV